MHMIFVNLLVRDLTVACDFYEALGFRLHSQASDEHTASVVVDDSIVVSLLTPERFADRVPGGVGDGSSSARVVHSLTVDDRADVDRLVERALAAGGQPWLPARDEESRYTGSFTDPDGHPWELLWMDQVHVVN